MKKNDYMVVKALDIKELIIKTKALRIEIADLVMNKNMKKLKDLRSISKKRKDIASVLTILRQKELLKELEAKK